RVNVHFVCFDLFFVFFFFFQAEDGIRDKLVTGVQTCALPIFPNLLRKIFMVDLIKGLSVTFRYQDPKEIYTEQYPLQRPQVAERSEERRVGKECRSRWSPDH